MAAFNVQPRFRHFHGNYDTYAGSQGVFNSCYYQDQRNWIPRYRAANFNWERSPGGFQHSYQSFNGVRNFPPPMDNRTRHWNLAPTHPYNYDVRQMNAYFVERDRNMSAMQRLPYTDYGNQQVHGEWSRATPYGPYADEMRQLGPREYSSVQIPMDSRYQQHSGYNNRGNRNEHQTTDTQGYNQHRVSTQYEQIPKRCYLDKLKEFNNKLDMDAEELINNLVSGTIQKAVKQLNRENGHVGKHADRPKYKRPKRFNSADQIKAYTVDDQVEYIMLAGVNTGFVRQRGVRGYFKETDGKTHDVLGLAKVLLDTEFEDIPYIGLDYDQIKCYILMNTIDFLIIPCKRLVYERNRFNGGLFTVSERTIKDLIYLNLEERPLIFLEGFKQTAVTTEDGKVIRQCRLIIVDDEQDEAHFYKDYRKINTCISVQDHDVLSVEGISYKGLTLTMEINISIFINDLLDERFITLTDSDDENDDHTGFQLKGNDARII